jgi:hypothetical protein
MRSGRQATIFDIMALTVAFALGYSVSLRLWAEQIPWPVIHGTSVALLPITWGLVVVRILGSPPARRRLFYPPGLAACVAVSVASVLSLCYGWDHPSVSVAGSLSTLSIAALRAVQPLPLAAAVAGTWLVLALDRRWRPEPSWIDRTARCLGLYWLVIGLIMPFLRVVFA